MPCEGNRSYLAHSTHKRLYNSVVIVVVLAWVSEHWSAGQLVLSTPPSDKLVFFHHHWNIKSKPQGTFLIIPVQNSNIMDWLRHISEKKWLFSRWIEKVNVNRTTDVQLQQAWLSVSYAANPVWRSHTCGVSVGGCYGCLVARGAYFIQTEGTDIAHQPYKHYLSSIIFHFTHNLHNVKLLQFFFPNILGKTTFIIHLRGIHNLLLATSPVHALVCVSESYVMGHEGLAHCV